MTSICPTCGKPNYQPRENIENTNIDATDILANSFGGRVPVKKAWLYIEYNDNAFVSGMSEKYHYYIAQSAENALLSRTNQDLQKQLWFGAERREDADSMLKYINFHSLTVTGCSISMFSGNSNAESVKDVQNVHDVMGLLRKIAPELRHLVVDVKMSYKAIHLAWDMLTALRFNDMQHCFLNFKNKLDKMDFHESIILTNYKPRLGNDVFPVGTDLSVYIHNLKTSYPCKDLTWAELDEYVLDNPDLVKKKLIFIFKNL
jgi:hypothetical protein